jgi:prevent-host-death family protein
MPVSPVSITEAKARLSQLVNRVAYGGERVVLESHGRPKAALVGLDDLQALEAGGPVARLKDVRLEALRRIETLANAIRKHAGRRGRRSAALDLAELRSGRDARLGRMR